MSWLLKTALDWRVWAAAIVGGLALSLWVATVERDRARDQAGNLAGDIAQLRKDVAAAETAQRTALADKQTAEKALSDYAQASTAAFQKQAEESARSAAQLAELNRRVRAANQEIARADGSLRLDDPLPRGVRDNLACAGGDSSACAAAADSGRVPGRAAEPAPPARAAAGGPDGA